MKRRADVGQNVVERQSFVCERFVLLEDESLIRNLEVTATPSLGSPG